MFWKEERERERKKEKRERERERKDDSGYLADAVVSCHPFTRAAVSCSQLTPRKHDQSKPRHDALATPGQNFQSTP